MLADVPLRKLPYHILRHRLSVRIAHWINSFAVTVLLISGAAIAVAHPQFYWGESGHYGIEPWLQLPFSHRLRHSGWGRNLHFLFAWVFVINGAIYVLSGFLNGHFFNKMLPSFRQLRPAHIKSQISMHLRLRRPRVSELGHYNLLQCMAYLLVIFVLSPAMLLSGMKMSPGFVAAIPELTEFFGGRQSARSIHFICTGLLALFFFVHLIAVARAGTGNMLRAMITGSFPDSKEKT